VSVSSSWEPSSRCLEAIVRPSDGLSTKSSKLICYMFRVTGKKHPRRRAAGDISPEAASLPSFAGLKRHADQGAESEQAIARETLHEPLTIWPLFIENSANSFQARD
ncbi:MAG: hypothetical protein ACREEJ_26525, partial [Ensifer adhaerens]